MKKNTFAHRQKLSLFLIQIGASVVFTLLCIRLAHIQVVSGAEFVEHADENRFFSQALPAPRGLILDRYHQPLVWNIQHYAQLKDSQALFSSSRRVSREEGLQLIASQGAQTVTTELQRLYRYPNSLAHTVGYVGEVTAEDLQRDKNLKPGMVVGKAGLELMFEDSLHGKEGRVTYEVNALGKKQRMVKEQVAQTGESIETSLDPYLSELAARKLGAVKGTVIITDVETGKILTLTSQPTFDPNIFGQVETDPAKELSRKEKIQKFFTDPQNLFFNRAISGAYPPGSVFKLVTAAGGLEQGKITDATEVIDTGVLEVNGFRFGNWYFRQYGRTEGAIQLQRAISRSNDIYFYKAAEWLGPQALADFARMFGYGSKIGVELPAEARGLVPDPAWKEKNRGEPWYLGNTYHFGIGQGDLLTTPLQVAQMTQAIAFQGKSCQLSILNGKTPNCQQLGVKPENIDKVIAGMIDACSNGGTAYPFFPFNTARKQEGDSVTQAREHGVAACKTGTAEFGGADAQGHRKTHGWFTVFVQVPSKKLSMGNENGLESTASAELASPSAQVSVKENLQSLATSSALIASASAQQSDEMLHQLWLKQVQGHGFPRTVGITVLVESDEAVPYREGSRDAGPIGKQIVDWLIK